MTDLPMTPYEQRFAARLRAFGDIDITPIDELAVARAAASSPRRLPFGGVLPRLGPMARLLLAAALTAAAVGTVVVGAGLIQPAPDPTTTPRASDRPRFPTLDAIGPTLNPGPETPSAVLLADGRVLIVHPESRAVETWDPRTGVFEPAGERPFAGSAMLARLGDGRVLVVGTPEVAETVSVDARSILIYDPVTQTFEDAPDAARDRGWCHCGIPYVVLVRPSLLELPDGRAMLVGGSQSLPGQADPAGGNHVELYDPDVDAFTSVPIGCAPQSRGAQAILPGPTRGLGDIHPGYVLVTCLDSDGNRARLFDLETDTFVDTGDPTTTSAGAMFYAGLKGLLTGDALGAAGGSAAEWYDLTTRTFSTLPTTDNPPADSKAVSLHDGRVLYLPYVRGRTVIYDPATPTGGAGVPFRETDLAPLTASHNLVWLGDGRFLVLGPLGAAFVLDRTLIP